MENSGMAPHEDEKAIEGLLRRNLARSADSVGVCPEPDILAAYFERSLDPDEIEHHEFHFSRCARCREQLAAMVRAAAPASVGDGTSPAASPWAWLGDWRWLAVPAAAMLAFVIIGFLHERNTNVKNASREAPASAPVALRELQQPPPESLVARQDEKKPAAHAAAPAQKPFGAHSTDARAIVPPLAAPNVLQPPKPAVDSARTEVSPAKTALNDKLTDTLAKAEVREQRSDTSAKLDAPRSMSETVEVTTAAPAVAAPAPPVPPANAGLSGGSGASAGAPSRLAANGANVKELEANAPRKKSKQESDAGAAQNEITSSMDYSAAKSLTVMGKLSSQMILTPDPQILWRFAGSGFVERSTDGGATWQGEEPSAGGQLVAGAAPSANVCWIVGRDGLILLTKDAKNWKKIPPPVEADFVAVSAESAPSATVTTADGRKFATKDGGKEWKPAEPAANPPQN
jgi:hypothetical protein